MERVIVTVRRYNDSQVRDIEVPVDIPVETLLREIPPAFGWSDHYEIYAEPPRRLLSPGETLLQAEVWDGARLTFRPSGSPDYQRDPYPPAPPAQPPGQGPVTGWRPLDVSSGPSIPSSQPPPQPTPSGGFVWKRVDED